ncbi:hypothetical protein ACFO5K_10360 [Nocardia halotolerans]|uniref:5,10-methylene-tetrahydrofolate dehydrogenase/Methenyl tetrahydrofolate cyclohydrolase n=1 Tax=Nocardia halotolerans TaxID=1755878 RepID=A0ABV8VEP9_9NOCA
MADERVENVTIGVLADPDLPARVAHRVRADLSADLARALDEPVHWRVEVNDDPFEAMYPDKGHLIDKARDYIRDTSWDLALCVTDLPLHRNGEVVVVEIDPAHQVALISLPAVGAVRLRRRLREIAVAVVGGLRSRRPESGSPALPMRVRGLRSVETDGELRLVRSRPLGTAYLLAGMVRANRPWQLVVGLSTALAGAMAGTAFGVLYSNIWSLATSMGPVRLAGVTVAALVALSTWLIAGHGLWERRDPGDGIGPDRHLALRNAGTLTTVAVGTVVFFLALYLISLGAVALVISPEYLALTLGRPAALLDYPTIALMATILGILAGAVGSGLEDDNTVRNVTYGYREQERRRVVEQRRRARKP